MGQWHKARLSDVYDPAPIPRPLPAQDAGPYHSIIQKERKHSGASSDNPDEHINRRVKEV